MEAGKESVGEYAKEEREKKNQTKNAADLSPIIKDFKGKRNTINHSL